MGRDLCDAYPEVKSRYFDRADQILGFSLSDLCFQGPEEELVRTEIQQPAIFLVSVATCWVLQEQGVSPSAVAGHSLGEYSALVAAGSLDFERGLALTRRRGELMAEVGARTGGIMAAILGLAPEEVVAACAESAHAGVVEVANFNSPTQTVISGEEAAVTLAMDAARARGAQRAIRLQVSAPFHCSLMAPLAGEFEPELQRVEFLDPQIPVVANVTAEYERDAHDIRANLVKQLASSVRWSDSIRRLVADGFDSFVEVGPGKVLTGLMRGIDPSVAAYRTDEPATLERTVTSLT